LLCSFKGDCTRWTQLLLNLAQNSVKFTASGFIKLDITASGFGRPGSTGCPSTLLVTVTDTGCGISKQGQKSLFEKYQQVHSQEREHRGASATTGSGTGLGLVICQHIVELMGGQISVKSPLSSVHPGAGPGSAFSFSVEVNDAVELDAKPAAAPSRAEVELSSPEKQLDGAVAVSANILVVDDELLNRMVLLTKLRQSKGIICDRLFGDQVSASELTMECNEAENAEQALDMMCRRFGGTAASATIDIIFLDEHMQSSGGVLKGSEAIVHFRRLAETHGRKQPFIVINSGNCTKQDTAGYLSMGANAVWPKPFPSATEIAIDFAAWVRAVVPDEA
jgi:CheY-like chemotaxis protein